ncbi:MAG TPA: protein phosphatase 2C domain-containing protein [Gallionella sp.]
MNFSIHQASHIGNRKFNQDRVAYAYSSDALLLVLADGMGGHLKGELAAGAIIDTFVNSFCQHTQPHISDPMKFLADTMRIAHQRIVDFSHEMGLGGFPGSTCVAALVQDEKLYWGYAGDSRLYLLRDGAVLTRTRDHSVVSQWLDSGVISAAEARVHPHRNQITNCLGGSDDIYYMEPGGPLALQSGDILLLASDGLWGPFTDKELVESFSSRQVPAALDDLITRALERESGRSDNITGAVMRWGRGEIAHDTAKPVCRILAIS